MTDGVYANVDPVEPAGVHSMLNRPAAETDRPKLATSNDSVLTLGQSSDGAVQAAWTT